MIKAYAKSDKGNVRETNEDYFYISNSLDEVQLYILADGMGGYNGGEQDADEGDGGEHGVVGKELLHRAPQRGGTEVAPRGIGVRIHFRHSRRLRSSGIRRPHGKSRRS